MASTATHPDASSLIPRVTEYARAYMANYDGSHDFNHIRRVLRLAQRIYASERARGTSDADQSRAESMVRDVLLGFGADPELADRVQAICLGVSYSSEIKDRAKVQRLIAVYPELAIVQDADRLDAIGAVGIGRTFAFGGAKAVP
ncbi:unnamed protein product [Parascedosporium putredinis]|uniref:Uncharacterized protein n=1 Tax=Parascedosporium putredinis TaxID=1442378 RepID=A0A9P1MBA3_9PEZI|nr:unnamed protein product [Parascedosporium putredinis]CAI7995559.1 unnamed protein product [Parascedosporium putredinis]